jgi:osmotically-inducible protein OsmY
VYQTRGDSSNRSTSGQSSDQEDQDESYPSYGYTPNEGDESQWQDTGETAQGRQMGRQRTSTSDMVLAQRIALELQRQLPSVQNIQVLDPHAIYVVVNQNTVTLHGHVQDRNLKQKAEQIARSISACRRSEQLIVAGEATTFPPLGYTPGQQSTTTGRSTTGTSQQMTTSDRNLAQQIDQQIRQQLGPTST